MNCQEARKIVECVLDRNLSGSVKRRLDLHLSRCKDCRAFFAAEQAEHQRWFKALNSPEVPRHSLPPDFADRLAAAVVANSAMRRSLFKRLPRWALIAASLALMAGFVFAAATVAEFDLPGFNRQSTEGDVKFEIEEIRDASPITEEGGQSMTMRRPAMTALSAALAAAPLTAAVADGGGYTSVSYVQDGLIAQWDGIDNAGTGTHDASATVWKDLKGSCDMTLLNNGESWVNGKALYVNGAGAAGSTAAPRYTTIEVVYKMAGGACLFVSGLKWGNTDWYISRIVAFSGGTRAIFTNAHSGQTIYIPDANGDVVHSLSAVYEDNSSDVVVSASMDGYVRTQNTVQTSWYDATGVVMVGDRKTTAKSEPWTGEIYAIRLYDRALSVGELAANQKVDSARFGVSEWYSCIASGDPSAAAIAGSCVAVEASPSAAIEARYRTINRSAGVALDSTFLPGTLVIIQ